MAELLDMPVGADIAEEGAPRILTVEDLRTEFRTADGVAVAVDGMSFDVRRGRTLAIVGESGSGKSVMSLSVMRLIPDPPGRIIAGRVLFDGCNLLDLDEAKIEKIRGRAISMIFQEPMTSLNPVLTIGRQMMEGPMEHLGLNEEQARDRAIGMLRKVNIPEPERVMIAIALSCNPAVLIADEPTTALDVTIQAQILDLMRGLQSEFGSAIVLITHDMGVVAEMADQVIVMYAGRKVEEGDVEAIFETPRHPYTRGLLAALPVLGSAAAGKVHRLNEIPGIVPPLTRLPVGCRFAPRCPHATERCRVEYPPFEEKARGHWAACWESERVV